MFLLLNRAVKFHLGFARVSGLRAARSMERIRGSKQIWIELKLVSDCRVGVALSFRMKHLEKALRIEQICTKTWENNLWSVYGKAKFVWNLLYAPLTLGVQNNLDFERGLVYCSRDFI